MKLYAKTTSERASKGQGGNKFIQIKLTVSSSGDLRNEIGIVTLMPNSNGGYILSLDRSSYGRDGKSARVYEEIIGKKQKDAKPCYCSDSDMSIPHYH